MEQLSFIISKETNPYHNIALEEQLMYAVGEQECILYLWQNRRTVVIGHNQNAWKECRTEELEADGGFLARRLSGGGAVFHDLGNLNFTFLVQKPHYDVAKQCEVILRAVKSFGIPAVRNGRNDLTVDGHKFSGHAFYSSGAFCYHHGTILIRADKEQMARYLSVSGEKLRSKGVDSVRSRVGNLSEYVPEMTVEQMQQALLRAFGEVYGGQPQPFCEERIPEEMLRERQQHFASWEWRYGRKIPFQYEFTHRFDWGNVIIQLEVSEGIIRQAAVWSDGLDIDFPQKLEQVLEEARFQRASLEERIHALPLREEEKQMALQVAEYLTDGN